MRRWFPFAAGRTLGRLLSAGFKFGIFCGCLQRCPSWLEAWKWFCCGNSGVAMSRAPSFGLFLRDALGLLPGAVGVFCVVLWCYEHVHRWLLNILKLRGKLVFSC